MDRTGYFRSINKLNIFLDFAAGNFLPLRDKRTRLGFREFLWMSVAWFVKLSYLMSVTLGTLFFADLTAEQMFQKFGAMAVLSIELLIPAFYLNLRRKQFRKLIKMYNAILIDSNDLRYCIRDSLAVYNRGLKFFMFASLCASNCFSAAPILKAFDDDQFTYVNFTVPGYLPGEPFGRNVFIAGIIFQIVGSGSVHVGIISLYLYIVNYIALLTGQYKYVRRQMTEALSEENGGKNRFMIDIVLQKCIRHHCAVIKVGRILIELLAFYVGSTYIICILEFCFLAFGIVTFESAVVEKFAYLAYIICRMVLVFMLCSCVQELLDASTSVMDDAFHENWFAYGRSVRKNFYMIQLGNQMECRITAYGVVDLVVPTLALILSKSYSVCLLLLNVK